MKNGKNSATAEILRLLPSVDAVLNSATAQTISMQTGAKHLTEIARKAVDVLRHEVLENRETAFSRETLLEKAESILSNFWRVEQKASLQRVINATGVIIHTNLGRAPLSVKAIQALANDASRYCNLEYDLESGKRGRRGARAERLLAQLTGAEDALIVNNCAAACVLVLTALAKNGEAILSRGEMVEIGGDFRIPDVMVQSGAILKEVGTTNRTKISDYEREINENTRLILKVHPSNYRIVGFTAAPSLAELAKLAHRNNILLYEDAGSGALVDLSEYGLEDEPVIGQSIAAGVDVVTFSGDKLLGATQSGLIVGKKDVIETLRKHPLYRALRVSKLNYAALEATLEFFNQEKALQEIPVLKMLSVSGEETRQRIENFVENLRAIINVNHHLQFEMIEGQSVIGGGSAPAVQPESTLLALKHQKMSVDKLEQNLRFSQPPVIARILDDRVLIDLRTVSESEEAELLKILVKLN